MRDPYLLQLRGDPKAASLQPWLNEDLCHSPVKSNTRNRLVMIIIQKCVYFFRTTQKERSKKKINEMGIDMLVSPMSGDLCIVSIHWLRMNSIQFRWFSNTILEGKFGKILKSWLGDLMSSGISGKVDAAMKGASIFRRVMSTFVRAGNGRPFRDDAHISRVSSCRGPAACDLHACQPRQQRKSV